jgi:DNA-binding GntR family transcriptional regulator
VYETLRSKILTLELPPGAALSENELAAELGTSRTPVRESLILLSEEGLVQVFPQIGSFVSRVDPKKVIAAQFLREAIELAALDDIPAHPDLDQTRRLQANLELQHAPDLDLEGFFHLDEEFHEGLLRLSGHADAWSTVVSAKGHLDRARRLGLHEADSPTRWVDQHSAVFKAVVAGDMAKARETLRQHLRTVLHDIERIQERSPDLFATTHSTPVRKSVAYWQ